MASLILSDGTTFEGESFGAPVDADGEVVFNTGMAGYPESLTDPSYRGQILVFTYPLIGNYGVPSDELNEWKFSKFLESENIHVRGVICAQVSEDYSHHAAKQSLSEWMTKEGIPGITGVDTRALTKKLREHGVMLGRMASGPSPAVATTAPSPAAAGEGGRPIIEDPNKLNLVGEVSCKEPITYDPSPASGNLPETLTVIAYDCGMKRNILRSFLKRGVRVVRVPWDFDLDSYDGDYDGVFFSNGPGDPKTCVPTIKGLKRALEKNKLTFGICLGNQLMALAVGGDTFKLKYGHRGANQPCVETSSPGPHPARDAPPSPASAGEGSARCIITSQNHGFAVDEKLPKGWSVWWRNANDQSVEGIRHESGRFFAVQFHPEATPGPEDANYLFDEFVALMQKERAGK
ncbi:MAG: glutamine-hydrolyzing carbamoyl-phosphate synthase small subunit [Candidatus Peribacteraceae bacterium]|nr:glutamine-hydrolyzing carbamoyl-phosphate synthase small subunit [Candidatus Peribacteraceae bacterium]